MFDGKSFMTFVSPRIDTQKYPWHWMHLFLRHCGQSSAAAWRWTEAVKAAKRLYHEARLRTRCPSGTGTDRHTIFIERYTEERADFMKG